MIPVGYMAKRVSLRPAWIKTANVVDVYSVSDCGAACDFCDNLGGMPYDNDWNHNGFWFFDSPELIKGVAKRKSIQLDGTLLFYYEVCELELDAGNWQAFGPEPSIPTNVRVPAYKRLEGFDVVTVSNRGAVEHSPLSCNSMADELATNVHCLFASLEEAQANLNNGLFNFDTCEPGPYRIFSVNSVGWG
jgi:hypothetical protein